MKNLSLFKEDLRKWFSSSHPEGGWKRINSKGEAIGPCAREPGEAKPKCMSNEKRAALSKKERASAVKAKRRHDPNPERKGKPINVSNFGKGKISEMKQLDEKNVPTSPEKWARAKAMAKSKFDVYPSAYANGWAAKKYKEMGGGWKSVSEAKEDDPPFTPSKEKRKAVAGKHGYAYSLVRHLARTAAQKQLEKLKVPVKKSASVVPEYDDPASRMRKKENEEKRKQRNENVELVELSNALLGRYKKSAGAQASAADKAGNFAKGNKRFRGIMKATKKQFANDLKKEETGIDEQHREEGRFKPTVPQKVPNVSVGSPSVRKTDGAKKVGERPSLKSAVIKDKFQPDPELKTTLTKNL